MVGQGLAISLVPMSKISRGRLDNCSMSAMGRCGPDSSFFVT
jgi:hypothetical protein